MPKRLIDGEGIWRSRKLKNVEPVWMRAEYANLVPLALADGTFECLPELVWAQVYAFNRPDVKVSDVIAILEEFSRRGMLFRWLDIDTGKYWGFWIGIDQDGRLPAKSLIDSKRVKTGKTPPIELLRQYLDDSKQGLGLVGNGLGRAKITAPPPKDSFAFEGQILKVTKAQHDRWASLYQGLNVAAHYGEADSWLVDHPEKPRKNQAAFTSNWLKKEWKELKNGRSHCSQAQVGQGPELEEVSLAEQWDELKERIVSKNAARTPEALKMAQKALRHRGAMYPVEHRTALEQFISGPTS